MERRDFLKTLVGVAGAAAAGPLLNINPQPAQAMQSASTARVAFVKTRDRAAGVSRALELLDINPVKGKTVFLKPNYNSADPTPGSTHLDALRTLIESLHQMGAGQITLGDRSGMGDTRRVLRDRGVFELADELRFDTLVFDELAADDWTVMQPQNSLWKRGFALPNALLNAESVVQTCCLKTHRFGGHFTLSLKNSVGLAAKFLPGDGYNYMTELHGSPNQRLMIAELNTAYNADLIVMDGVEAFVDGGPDRGTKVDAEVILASTDRVAIDAVGVAILRHFGTTPAVSKGRVFEQAQIAHAAALGVGISAAENIELVTDDADSAAYAEQIRRVLVA